MNKSKKQFFLELIRPSLYDEQGYVIQWLKSFSISNSLACLYGLSIDCKQRKILGEDVEIIINIYDENSKVLPVKSIINRIHGNGLVCLVGVQTNQYPRALDIGRQFREADIPVVIGGFHVSGCLAMLPKMPEELQEAIDLGITLFAGEAEGRMEGLISDAYKNNLKPIYSYLGELRDFNGQATPFLPWELQKEALTSDIPIDTSRGCPFECTFCTVINVQGRSSRFRSADEVEHIIRTYKRLWKKSKNFFFTDDNFSRNKNWENILDRLIELKNNEDFKIKFSIQIDVLAYKIPRFVDKAAEAGCNSVFIGMESINAENLKAAGKPQNQVKNYREMLQTWRDKRVVTVAGYILGLPEDTPKSIEEDIKTIQRELPVDILMFFNLTPLPGSVDHKNMLINKEWMEPDLNKYNCIYVTSKHPKMSKKEWEDIFFNAWNLYYTPQHVETIFRRAISNRISINRLIGRIMISHCGMNYESVHPFQLGAFRRKIRRQRRFGMALENPIIFYPRRIIESIKSTTSIIYYFWTLTRLKKRLASEISK